MAKTNEVLFILTGGTIDGYINPGEKPKTKGSPVQRFLQKLKLHQRLNFERACAKDSRELTDSDRAKMLSIIRKAATNRVIITHGTFTMAETTRYLKKRLGNSHRVIVLTGALAPFGEPFSDAEINIGYALRATQTLDPGVYLCMNGSVFRPENVYKNAKTKFFEEA
jgi:L-asparaginase